MPQLIRKVETVLDENIVLITLMNGRTIEIAADYNAINIYEAGEKIPEDYSKIIDVKMGGREGFDSVEEAEEGAV